MTAIAAANHSTAWAILDGSCFFQALPPEARSELASHFQRQMIPAGHTVVREGQAGDCFYLIAAGEAEVWVRRGRASRTAIVVEDEANWKPDPAFHQLIARRGPGEGFGETALLTGGRRTATVRAVTDLELYALDGATFAHVVDRYRGLAVALEEEMLLRGVVSFLGSGSPFNSLPPDALQWLASRLEPMHFEPGQDIVREGEPGDALYILRSGEADVLVHDPDGAERRIEVRRTGEAFGEQALVTSEPRSATVRAIDTVEVLRLRRDDFEHVLHEHRDRGQYFLQLALQRQRPRRIEHWALERQTGRGGEVTFVLKDTRRHRYMRLSEQGAFLWDLMDGQHTVRDLTQAYFARYHLFGLDAVMNAMFQLNAAGFVHIQRLDLQRLGAVAALNPVQRLGLTLMPWLTRYYSLPDVDRAVTTLYQLVFHWLYRRAVQVALLGATVVGAVLFVRHLLPGGPPIPTSSLGGLALTTVVGFALHGVLHELGHALTAKHFRREVHRAGVGWYLFIPVAFVDTSDVWLADRLPRMAVAIAGPYVNFVLAGLAALLLTAIAHPVWQAIVFQFAATGYIIGLTNMNPLVEYDAYYALMDAVDIPNLRAKALAFLGALLWRAGAATRDPRLRRIFGLYGGLALLYTLIVAVATLTGYQSVFRGAVSRFVPTMVATLLGWVVAGLMAWLILQRAWVDLRRGARSASGPSGFGNH